ncbi:hypothetical protein AO063_05620 [Pseudomonas fluorescens ICMP 11288]|uniref:Uncharacterized protein n=1 Tax=Pseudomonas fluorescens ICMP 11288 TaxID=1198309 RepID=A0A0W0H8T8_PSEFL|nr:hypothetical protein AO063_05620 [Pseudomonas fluorescens ICMP 11288]
MQPVALRVTKCPVFKPCPQAGTRSAPGGIPTQSVGTSELSEPPMIVPTLRVGMQPLTLRVTECPVFKPCPQAGTLSAPGGIPTQSVGTSELSEPPMIIPTLRVGMQPVALRVTKCPVFKPCPQAGTRSAPGGIPTQSVGTSELSEHR